MIKINFKVTEDEVTKINQVGDSTTGSIGQIKCTFDLDPIYTDLTCVAVFNDIKIPMIRGECYADNIPEGRCVVGVYAYSETDGSVDKRISPKPCVIVVDRGSYLEGHDPEPPTASETERFYNLINEALKSGKLKGEKGDKGDKGDTYELTAQDKRDIINQIPNASPSERGLIQVPWGCGILVDEDGSAKVTYPVTDITTTTDDIKIVVHTGGSKNGQYDLTFNSEKYAKKTELPKKTSELQNDSNFVSDENYIHTDNNFTKEEKDKLGTLTNYNDTAIKKQIAEKQDKLSTAQLNNISAVPNKQDKLSKEQLNAIASVSEKQDKLTTEQLNNISAVPNKQDKITYDLICNMTVDENNQIIGSDNRPYVEITTDLNGKAFNYQKVLINVVFPSTISSTVYPYFQIANRSGSFGNVFGYGTKNVKIINGTVERLPNTLFDCNFIFQTSDYYGIYKISTLNADKYLIQSDGITKIRFMLRQTDMTIPTGTTIKIWGIK